MKTITLRVSRYDPAADEGPHIEEYTVRVNDGARVLHALHAVHDEHDPTLTYRYCCGSGQCGSCAVRVDGTPGLACMEEARDGMTVEPLDLPVVKDLAVDMSPVIAKIARICPAPDAGLPAREEIEAIKPLRDCIECLSCVSACPALQVTEFAGPTVLRQEMRLALDPRDSGDRITDAIEKGLFYCTTCKRCLEVCPKEIDIPGKAIEKLRELANRRGLTLPHHREIARLIEETGRSVERTKTTFLEQVPEVIEPDGPVRGEVGFFVGCMFNGRVPQTALDAMEVMKRNGIRVIVPHDQVCCGSPLIRTGQTICAGCGATLKNDYETPFEVKDVTEVLTEYGIEPPAKLDVRATYHDPCHLLRGQGIREQPRALLREAVREFVEMPAQCCGAGGGVRSGVPEEAKALGSMRGEAVKETGADVVVTVCPFCEFHIADCTDVPVKNLVTVLLDGYRKKDAERQKPA